MTSLAVALDGLRRTMAARLELVREEPSGSTCG